MQFCNFSVCDAKLCKGTNFLFAINRNHVRCTSGISLSGKLCVCVKTTKVLGFIVDLYALAKNAEMGLSSRGNIRLGFFKMRHGYQVILLLHSDSQFLI
jgi:hypothetical protein